MEKVDKLDLFDLLANLSPTNNFFGRVPQSANVDIVVLPFFVRGGREGE